MNEQEMIINEKIKKREKIDTILAYMLIIILLGAILLVLYLKFIRKNDEVVTPNEYTPSYISLIELSNSFNTSKLVTDYTNNNIALSSSVAGNILNINYVKGENNITLNIPLIGNELQVEYKTENKNIAEDIYKEIATIVCVYNGNIESSCRNTINNIGINNQINGIRIIENENTTTTYIDIMKKIEVNDITTYTEITPVDISNTNYILSLEGIQIDNININNNENKLIIKGNVKSLNNDKMFQVQIKLYDENDKLLKEKVYEYTEANPLNESSVFEIEFELNEELKKEDIKKYSVEIIK